MRDGRTRKLPTMTDPASGEAFFRTHRARLVALTGRNAGTEYELDAGRVTLGRGPGVDLVFDDAAMSRQHAAVEFVSGEFRVVDLGSTNGIRVDGNRVSTEALEPGSRIEVGTQVLQLGVEEREDEPEAWVIDG